MRKAKVKQAEELDEALASAELPEEWTSAMLADVLTFALGGQWGNAPAEHVPPDYMLANVIRGTEFRNWIRDKGSTAAVRMIDKSSFQKRQLCQGDIVVEISGGGPDQPVGRSLVIDKEALQKAKHPLVCSNFCRQIRLHSDLSSRYVASAIQYAYSRGELNQFQTETTNIRNLNFTDFISCLPIPVAPTAEQKRIVAKVEVLLAEVNKVQARLEKVPKILKTFRQSVLAAACSGRLTEDWRAKHPEAEPAATLIDRIRALRTSNSKGRQILEPVLVEPGSAEFNKVPDGWLWAEFGSIIGELRNGISTKPEKGPPGNPILRISSVRSGTVLLDEVRYLPDSDEFKSVYRLHDGDLLFTRYNGSLDLLGVGGMVRGLGKRIILYPDKLMRVRIDHPYVVPEYAEIFFQAPAARERMTAKSKSSAGQQGISGADVKAQPLALPPFEEQEEIVRRVEALFKLADTIEKRVESARKRAEKITQAILAKAFRGELVPTEAELARRESRPYEPASTLLERIRQQHTESQHNAANKHRFARQRKERGRQTS